MERTSQASVPPRDIGREVWLAGAGAGALGGLVMMAWMMGSVVLDGESALASLREVGTLFRGRDARLEGAGTIAWGIVVHLAVGALLGVLFAAIVPRSMPLPSSVVLGAGCALFWMAFSVRVLLPWLGPVLLDHLPRHGGAWVIAHAIFGAVTGIAPWLRRRIGERSMRPTRARPPGALRPRTSP